MHGSFGWLPRPVEGATKALGWLFAIDAGPGRTDDESAPSLLETAGEDETHGGRVVWHYFLLLPPFLTSSVHMQQVPESDCSTAKGKLYLQRPLQRTCSRTERRLAVPTLDLQLAGDEKRHSLVALGCHGRQAATGRTSTGGPLARF